MVGKALGVLEGALDCGDTRAAVEVLKAAQVYGQVGAPKGPEDADLIRLEEARAWARVEALKQSGGDVLYATIAEQDLIAQRFGELQAQGQG